MHIFETGILDANEEYGTLAPKLSASSSTDLPDLPTIKHTPPTSVDNYVTDPAELAPYTNQPGKE